MATCLNSEFVKKEALELGFTNCGIARAKILDTAKQRFEESIGKGLHASMHFLERDVDKRFNPALLLPNCQSVIVVAYNYLIDVLPASSKYRTARYTWIEDYHYLINDKLEQLAHKILDSSVSYRITVDSSCISEKNWAVEAGIGCYGKNGVIYNEGGSFFVLGTLLTDCAADKYDSFRNSDCGECHLCQDLCPAKALDTPYQVDARKCYSYHTIENKNPDNKTLKDSPLLFGCDVCQEVCPKNKKNDVTQTNQSKSSLFLPLQNRDWEALTEEGFKTYFGNTSVARRKYQRFYRAIEVKATDNQE